MTTGGLSCANRRIDSAYFIVDNVRPFPLQRAIDSAQKGGTNIRCKRTAAYCGHIQSSNQSTSVRSFIAGNTGMTWYPTEHGSVAVLYKLGSNAETLFNERIIKQAE
jgi:hypothetical protein